MFVIFKKNYILSFFRPVQVAFVVFSFAISRENDIKVVVFTTRVTVTLFFNVLLT